MGHEATGCELDMTTELAPEALLFGESPSRIVISFDPEKLESVRRVVGECPFEIIGRVNGDRLEVTVNGTSSISAPTAELEHAWSNALGSQLDI